MVFNGCWIFFLQPIEITGHSGMLACVGNVSDCPSLTILTL